MDGWAFVSAFPAPRESLSGYPSLLDALAGAWGSCVVRIRNGRVEWMADASRALHEWPVWYAERALNCLVSHGLPVHPASYAALETKRRWLRGEADREQLFEAQVAARMADSHGIEAMAQRVAANPPWNGAAEAVRWGAWLAANAVCVWPVAPRSIAGVMNSGAKLVAYVAAKGRTGDVYESVRSSELVLQEQQLEAMLLSTNNLTR